MMTKQTSPSHNSIIIYKNQRVEQTLQYVLSTIYIHIGTMSQEQSKFD